MKTPDAANLPDRLRRWATARDRRLAQGGHAGVTGTELLREAAEEIERLRRDLAMCDTAYRSLAEPGIGR